MKYLSILLGKTSTWVGSIIVFVMYLVLSINATAQTEPALTLSLAVNIMEADATGNILMTSGASVDASSKTFTKNNFDVAVLMGNENSKVNLSRAIRLTLCSTASATVMNTDNDGISQLKVSGNGHYIQTSGGVSFNTQLG